MKIKNIAVIGLFAVFLGASCVANSASSCSDKVTANAVTKMAMYAFKNQYMSEFEYYLDMLGLKPVNMDKMSLHLENARVDERSDGDQCVANLVGSLGDRTAKVLIIYNSRLSDDGKKANVQLDGLSGAAASRFLMGLTASCQSN